MIAFYKSCHHSPIHIFWFHLDVKIHDLKIIQSYKYVYTYFSLFFFKFNLVPIDKCELFTRSKGMLKRTRELRETILTRWFIYQSVWRSPRGVRRAARSQLAPSTPTSFVQVRKGGVNEICSPAIAGPAAGR